MSYLIHLHWMSMRSPNTMTERSCLHAHRSFPYRTSPWYSTCEPVCATNFPRSTSHRYVVICKGMNHNNQDSTWPQINSTTRGDLQIVPTNTHITVVHDFVKTARITFQDFYQEPRIIVQAFTVPDDHYSVESGKDLLRFTHEGYPLVEKCSSLWYEILLLTLLLGESVWNFFTKTASTMVLFVHASLWHWAGPPECHVPHTHQPAPYSCPW